MRKSPIFILLFCLWSIVSFAQEVWTNRSHQDVLTLRWGGVRQYDEYLSPLLYSGQFIALQNEWWQQFAKTQDWFNVGKLKIQGARTFNPTYSNSIYALGVQAGWGAAFDFNRLIAVNKLCLYVGPYADFDFYAKELINNVNKPYSFDISFDAKLLAGISYSFSARRTSYRVGYSVLTSLLGAQFIPQYGQSYYEITEGIIGGTIGFSSLHNRLTLRQELYFDFQFPHSAWRLGIEHEYINNRMNGLGFQREQVSLVVGTVFNYKTMINKF